MCSEAYRHSIIYALLYVTSAFGLLLGVILTVPFYIYQKCVIGLVHCCRRNELTCMLSPKSTVFADLYYGKFQNPNHLFLVSVLTVKGNMKMTKLKSLFHENVIKAEINGSFRYPELRQFPCSFMGYWFWKWDAAYNIDNHIQESDKLMESSEQVHQYMINRPEIRDRSPWEVLLFSAPQNGNFVAISMHHCLGDTKSMVKLIVECLCNKPLCTATAKKKFKRKLGWKDYIFRLPHTAVCLGVDRMRVQYQLRNHPWFVKSHLSDTSGVMVRMSREVELDDIRSALSKNCSKACTSAFVIAAITGAVREFSKKYYNLSGFNDALPIYYTLHKPDHPQCLANHVESAVFGIPTHFPEIRGRLEGCDKIYSHMTEQSLDPISLEMIEDVGLTFVRWMRIRSVREAIFATGMTNVAGENEQIFLGALPCTDYSFTFGMGRWSLGVVFVVFSYRLKIKISVIAKECVLDVEKLTSLTNFLNCELSALME